ncbi:MAG TPA: hypothetical protein VHR86_01130 [Armatimonadota bacterium]|nr:hypothetical protein [Armatimonadota bacterium]
MSTRAQKVVAVLLAAGIWGVIWSKGTRRLLARSRQPRPDTAPGPNQDTAQAPAEELAAREAAVFFAHEAILERAVPGERAVVLAVGTLQAQHSAAGLAQVCVPLEISISGKGQVPRKENMLLHVHLDKKDGAWQVNEHHWEAAP